MPIRTALVGAVRSLAAPLVVALALGAGPAARADAVSVDLVDACLDPASGRITAPLVLTGDEALRPSSLRAVVAFDPAVLAPDGTPAPGTLPEAPAVAPGAVLGASGVGLEARVDAEAGRIELLWHRSGRLPVRPLPAGELARVRLRLRPGTGGEPWIELPPGETGALDGNGRPGFVATGPPVRPAAPGAGPSLDLVQEDGATFIVAVPAGEAAGSRAAALILRGRLDRARGLGRRVMLGPLQPLPSTADGLVAADAARPEAGSVFVYLAAAPDASGRASLGFGSDCRVRQASPERAAGR